MLLPILSIICFISSDKRKHQTILRRCVVLTDSLRALFLHTVYCCRLVFIFTAREDLCSMKEMQTNASYFSRKAFCNLQNCDDLRGDKPREFEMLSRRAETVIHPLNI